ncbi:restriction endonuclease subunit S [Escherichia coli]|nr:restriction endonuclease subunit S [Escherichia coli]
MSFELYEYKIEDLGKVITGKTPPSKISDAFSAQGIPFVTPKDMDGRRLIDKTERYLSSQGVEAVRNCLLPQNSIAVSCIGSDMGKTVLLPGESITNQQINAIVVDSEHFDYKYVYYYLSTLQDDFKAIAGGSATPILNKGHFSQFKVSLPVKPVQNKIALILDSLDTKIEVNTEINHTLEQMAQALFKSWFVDFEPVKAKMAVLAAGGSQEDATLAAMTAISGKDADALAVFEREHPEQYAELKATAELFPSAMQDSELGAIPEGWNIGKLGDIIEFNPKRVLKKGNIAPYLDMKNVPVTGHSAQEIIDREFSSGSKFRNGDTLLARITPCLENGKTAFVDFLLTDEMIGWGSTEFIIMRSKKSLPLSLSYFLARLDYFRTIAIQSMQGTSGRQRADAFVLEQHIWVVPPNEILKKFGIFSDSVLNCNRARNAENNALTQLRDTLLPKLLSGEITLPEAEQIISEEA